MIKKIEAPDWGSMFDLNFRETEKLNKWFDEHIEPINKALDEAIEVYSNKNIESEDFFTTKNCGEQETHKALLINIEPIKQESCADVLQYLLDECNAGRVPYLSEIKELSEKALEREGK